MSADIYDLQEKRKRAKPEPAAPPPWFRFFAGEWIAKTSSLSAAETGILITMIADMHLRGEPAPENHPRMARLCRVPTRNFKRALDSLVDEGLIIRVAGGLWSPIIQSEVDHRNNRSAAKQKDGDMSMQKCNVMSGKKPIKSMAKNDRVSESQRLREREGGLQPPDPLRPSPTLEKGDPPALAEGELRVPFNVEDEVVHDGSRYQVEAINGTVADIRCVWTGETSENVPLAELEPTSSTDDMDDETPP